MRIFFSTSVMACLLLPSVVQAKSAKEDSVFSLTAVAGAEGGYCVLKTDTSSGEVKLLTQSGALSKEQLGQALLRSSAWTRILVFAGPDALLPYFYRKMVVKTITEGDGINAHSYGTFAKRQALAMVNPPIVGPIRFLKDAMTRKESTVREGNLIVERVLGQAQEPAYPGGCDHI